MFEMPLVIPLFYYPLWLGFMLMLLSILVDINRKRRFCVGIILFCIGILMWFFVPGLVDVIW